MLTPTRTHVKAVLARRPPATMSFGSFDMGDLLVGCIHLRELMGLVSKKHFLKAAALLAVNSQSRCSECRNDVDKRHDVRNKTPLFMPQAAHAEYHRRTR